MIAAILAASLLVQLAPLPGGVTHARLQRVEVAEWWQSWAWQQVGTPIHTGPALFRQLYPRVRLEARDNHKIVGHGTGRPGQTVRVTIPDSTAGLRVRVCDVWSDSCGAWSGWIRR